MRIAHLSDIQIRNFRRHQEFIDSFENLYKSLREKKIDAIVVAGDIAHTKTQISPEFVEICIDFFFELKKIAPLYIVPGNHDGNLNNLTRQDAITPLVKALKDPRIFYYKHSGVFKSIDPGINFVVYSCFDQDWPSKSDIDQNKINIGLFHGFVNGAKLQNGQLVEDTPYELNKFLESVDYLMLGDIHQQQFLDKEKRAAYPGSLIQQNFGESLEHGYLLWEIESKNKHNVEFVVLPNVFPFYTLEVTDELQFETSLNWQKGARIRVFSRQLTVFEKKELTDKINSVYAPSDLSWVDNSNVHRQDVKLLSIQEKLENLDDLAVQEKLLREYLRPYDLAEDHIQKILEINKSYNNEARKDDEIFRNIQYNLGKMKFHNTFSYGEDNEFDFAKYKGIVGVFGKNGTGKALDVNTEIPTTSGWKTIKDINVGDFVFGPNGKPTKVIAKSPLYSNRICYEVCFSDDSSVVCDSEHLWTVEDHHSRAKKQNIFQTLTTRTLKNNLTWRNKEKNIGREWSVDVSEPVEYDKKELPIHPYTLGCWLGDGTSSNSGFTSADAQIIENLNNFGENVVKQNGKKNIAYTIKNLITKLKKINLNNDKHIPDIYLQSSVKDRRLLLAGLLDTDGYCDKRGQIEFCSTNKKLAYDFLELVSSLGYKATISESDAKLYGRVVSKKYRIYFKTSDDVFLLSRKNKNIHKNTYFNIKRRFIVDIKSCRRRLVQCLVVDNESHLFLVTRNFIPTHNSSVVVDIPLYTIFNKISKEGVVKNDLIINEDKEDCAGEIEIQVGPDKHVITRATHVYVKSGARQGSPVLQGKTEVAYKIIKRDGTEEDCTAEQRQDTDKLIRQRFGTAEDFISTSMSPQWQLLGIVNAKSTERLKLIGRYFDIDIFAKKHKLANDEWKGIKGQLKLFEKRNFDEEFTIVTDKAEKAKASAEFHQSHKNIHAGDVKRFDIEITQLQAQVVKLDTSVKDFDEDRIVEWLRKSQETINELEARLKTSRELTEKKNSFDFNCLKSQGEIYNKIHTNKKLISTLANACGCVHQETCSIHEKIAGYEKQIEEFQKQTSGSEDEFKKLWNDFAQIKPEPENRILDVLSETKRQHDEVLRDKDRLTEYRAQDIINKDLQQKINKLIYQRSTAMLDFKNSEQSYLHAWGDYSKQCAILEEIAKSKKEYERIKKEFDVYGHFISAMSKDGIVKKIVSDNLNIINSEIKKILAKGVGFEVEIESTEDGDGKAIEIYFKHESSKKRRIELCSGMEKSISALVIRAALINVTTLPKCNIFVLDEPFGSLDAEYKDSVTHILDYLKSVFDCVILITHDEYFRDIVDHVVEISRNDEGYSVINY